MEKRLFYNKGSGRLQMYFVINKDYYTCRQYFDKD